MANQTVKPLFTEKGHSLGLSPKDTLERLIQYGQQNFQIQLYDSNTIEKLIWPNTKDGEYAKRFLTPLIKNGIDHYVNNIHADIYALKINHFILPVIVTNENYDDSYVVSPFGLYIGYAKASLKVVGNKYLAAVFNLFLSGLGRLCRIGQLNSAVYVNNWLFSTDLCPDGLSSKEIKAIVNFLKERFPTKAIVLRSIDPATNASLLDACKNAGFNLVASRQVFTTNTQNEEIFQTRIIKSDLKLFRETSFEISDEWAFSSEECRQLLSLYQSLYLTNHSYLNPQFNDHYMRLLAENSLLRFKILKSDGLIKGVAGYMERNGIMFCPFFGYDKEDPQHNTVYRLLSTALLLEAKENGLIFHQSSGASFYKSVRRAKSCLEYMAVYTQHLPMKQKITWGSLRLFINTFGPRYMRKY